MKKIAVCIKQVPNSTTKMNEDTGILERETSGKCMNMYDFSAIETALRIKEKIDAEIYVFTMGPSSAKEVLREAYSLGVDKCVLISDRSFSGSDVFATSYIISKAIQYIGKFDLVICGKQTTDGDTAQIAGALSKQMGISYSPWVVSVDEIKEDNIKVQNKLDNKIIISQSEFPLVISVEPSIYTVRMASLTNKLKSRKKEIIEVSNEDLKLEDLKIGANGSPTKVIKISKNKIEKNKKLLEINSDEILNLINNEIKNI